MERVVEQGANAFTLDWSGVWIGAGDSEIRSTLDPIWRHADVFERDGRVQAPCKIEQAFGGAGRSQHLRHSPHGLGRCRLIVGDRVREHDSMSFSMGEIERAAKDVAELMMQRHPDASETHSARPRSVKRIGAGIAIGRLAHDSRKCAGKCCNPFHS